MQDLLSKILVAEPNDRYNIKNIIQHPWFQTDLPSRALKMNDDYIQLTPEGQGFQQLDEIKAILNEAKVEPKTVRKKEVWPCCRILKKNIYLSIDILCIDFDMPSVGAISVESIVLPRMARSAQGPFSFPSLYGCYEPFSCLIQHNWAMTH